MKILFSESKCYYYSLGLTEIEGFTYTFDGMKNYANPEQYFDYDMFVCSFYSLPHNYVLTKAFKINGVRTLLVSDGIFDYSNAFYNKMHTQYGFNLYFPIQQDFFLAVDKPGAEILSANNRCKVFRYMPTRIINNSRKIPIIDDLQVLITTANTAYFSDEEFQRLARLIVGIIIYFNNNSVKFRVRLFDRKLLDFIESEGLDYVNDTSESFECTLSDYTHVITTPSSISITSMYHERSVMTLSCKTTPITIQSAWNISALDQFYSEVTSFLEASSEKKLIQKSLLRLYLIDTTLTEAIRNVLDSDFESELNDRYLYLENSYFNRMMNSKFNFNVEYFVRNVYKFIKGSELVKRLRSCIRW